MCTGCGCWSWTGFGRLRFGSFHYLLGCAWVDGSLAESVVQLGKMVEHLNKSQPKQGPRPPAPPCTLYDGLIEHLIHIFNPTKEILEDAPH